MYHSVRYVDEKLVIRLKVDIGEQFASDLTARFGDLLSPGGTIVRSGPLPAEENEPEYTHLPRLIVDFNRRSFGRLRALVDALNGIEGYSGD